MTYSIYDELGAIEQLINESHRDKWPIEIQIYLRMVLLTFYISEVYPMDHWKSYKTKQSRIWDDRERKRLRRKELKYDLKILEECLKDETLLY